MNNTAENMDNNQQETVSKGFDFQAIIERAKEIILTPDIAFEKIRAERTSIPDIYKNYLLVIAAIGAIANWIKFSVIGITVFGITVRQPIFTGLISGVLMYGLQMVMIYVSALILEKLAPKFEGSASIENTFKLVAYAGTPAAIAAGFVIVPWFGPLIMIAGAVYSIYLIFKALPKFVEVPEGKRHVYMAASIGCIFVAGLIMSLIVGSIDPAMNYRRVDYGSQGTVDLNELEEKMKNLQNFLPKS